MLLPHQELAKGGGIQETREVRSRQQPGCQCSGCIYKSEMSQDRDLGTGDKKFSENVNPACGSADEENEGSLGKGSRIRWLAFCRCTGLWCGHIFNIVNILVTRLQEGYYRPGKDAKKGDLMNRGLKNFPYEEAAMFRDF